MDRKRGRFTREDAQKELERRGVWRYVEPILTMGSAAIAEPVSGLMGLAALPYGVDASNRAIANTQEAMTYQPRTEDGQQGLQDLGEFMQPVGDAFIGASEYLGDAAYNATGSPVLGAAAYSIPTMALEALGLKGARYASKGRAAYEMGDIGTQASKYGGKQRGIFAGVKAKGADLKQMEAAQELANRGVSRDEIWAKTGWFEDVDGKWKFEIDDSGLRVSNSGSQWDVKDRGISAEARIAEANELLAQGWSKKKIEKYSDVTFGSDGAPIANAAPRMVTHEALGDSYDLSGVNFDLQDMPEGALGFNDNNYTSSQTLIALNKAMDDAKKRKVVGHELQHSIQDAEGFARGGSISGMADEYNNALHNKNYYEQEAVNARLAARETPEYKAIQSDIDAALELDDKESLRLLVPKRRALEDAAAREYDLEAARLSEKTKLLPSKQYERLAGEAEARNVETRLDYTPEQRRATPPWKTLDVPENELIVRRGNGPAMSLDTYYRGTTGQDPEAGIKWVTKDKNLASEYAEHQGFRLGKSPYVEMIDADIKRPLKFRHAEQRKPIEEFLGEIMEQLDDGVGEFADEAKATKQYQSLKAKFGGGTQEINQYWRDPEVREFIENAGFDAIEVPEQGANGVMTYGLIK